jgi:hypothetical protein
MGGKYLDRIRKAQQYVAAARTHKSLPGQLVDLVLHKIRINTSPIDYYRFAFYEGKRSWSEKARYVGKRGSQYYPYQRNAVRYTALFLNKVIFKAVLGGFQLPQPRLVATIGPSQEIRTREAFAKFLSAYAGDLDLVLKPILGSGGRNVRMLSRDAGGLRANGELTSSDALWNAMIDRAFNDGYLIEERVGNPPGLRSLHPEALNTYRVVTVQTLDGHWHVATVVLRVGRARSHVDNISAGGLCVFFDDGGVALGGYDWVQNARVDRHPDTGVPLEGFKAEGYDEAVDLALRASEKFSFMGTIGWDIAATDNGPMILEGNAFYDCLYWQVSPGKPLISDAIARGLPKRHMFSHWDRRYLHPRFNRHAIRT